MLLSDGGSELPRKYAVAIEHPIYGTQYRLKTAELDGPFWHPFVTENTVLFEKQTDADKFALAIKDLAPIFGDVYMTAKAAPITPATYWVYA